jgi:hypothetical protein
VEYRNTASRVVSPGAIPLVLLAAYLMFVGARLVGWWVLVPLAAGLAAGGIRILFLSRRSTKPVLDLKASTGAPTSASVSADKRHIDPR